MIIRLNYTDRSFSYIYSPDKLIIKKKDLVQTFNKWWNDNLVGLVAG
ncbi:hypothetical protein [Terrisporobacter mayombei]|nr:hypothetical protein [Terrisporobacter mayombei]MCC3869911.1 hypothetical protein [Terrisporobacter mayombei]